MTLTVEQNDSNFISICIYVDKYPTIQKTKFKESFCSWSIIISVKESKTNVEWSDPELEIFGLMSKRRSKRLWCRIRHGCHRVTDSPMRASHIDVIRRDDHDTVTTRHILRYDSVWNTKLRLAIFSNSNAEDSKTNRQFISWLTSWYVSVFKRYYALKCVNQSLS